MKALMLAVLALTTINVNAADVNTADARMVAKTFLKQQVAGASGMFKFTSLPDLRLAHAESSSTVVGVNDYYAFNIDGGGFIIVSGEDRATPILGYSDQGRIDFDNLPAPLRDLLDGYKQEIEYLRTFKEGELVAKTPSIKDSGTVGPLIATTWGQEMPYYLQCPVYQGDYCVVGCVATAMAQVMNYWQYPTSITAKSRYYCYSIGGYVPALSATTIDYSLMLNSYCHWDYDNSVLVQDTYTDAQAQEVAKLGRYCGQAVQMDYSPEGSGAYTTDQLNAMKNFGYSNATYYSKGGGWWGGGSNYTTEQWEAMLKTEIDAGRPILYSANDPSAGGHAFICDGYNSDGKFHFNLGWYGTCDGWYATTALNMVHRDGDQLKFSSGHEIISGLQPPTYCNIFAQSLDAANNLLIVGENDLDAQAINVTLNTTYTNVNLLFALTDADGNVVVNGDAVNIVKNSFTQGSTVNGTIVLPADLPAGVYNLKLYYYTTNANQKTLIKVAATGQLNVVGHLARYNSPFSIADVTTIIDCILIGNSTILDISDVTELIDYILTAQ